MTPREQLAREEAETLVHLLTRPGGRAAVLVLHADGTEATLTSATSPQLTAGEIAAFLDLIEQERSRLATILAKACPDA